MKKYLILLSFITVLIVTFLFSTHTFAYSESTHGTYEMQRAVKIEKKVNFVRSTTQKYYVSQENRSLIQNSKSSNGYDDFEKRSNPQGRKILYDKLFEVYGNIYTEGNITGQLVELQNGTFESFNIVESINFSQLGLTYDEALSTYFIFRHDNPIFYYSSNTFLADEYTMYALVLEDYANEGIRKKYSNEIANAINSYKAMTEHCEDQYSKILKIHDNICENMYYEYVNDSMTGQLKPSEAAYAHNILGVLVEGKGVCESYARTFELILNNLNINNFLVTGKSFGENHAWNLVELDGYYYWIDCTWDDTETDLSNRYIWFMKGIDSWDNHLEDKPTGTVTFLYDLPINNISDISITYKGIEVKKNNISLGKANTSRDAIGFLTTKNANYEFIFDNKYNSYIFTAELLPEVNSLKLTSSPKNAAGGGSKYTSVEFCNDITINSDLTLDNIYISTESGTYSKQGHKCVDFNIGKHKINIPENTTVAIGGRAITQFVGNDDGSFETYDFNRMGLNIKGTQNSAIICKSSGFVNIDCDELLVDKIEGNFLTMNVGNAHIGNIYGLCVQFTQDYNVVIDNLYVSELTPEACKPTNYNATANKKVNIGNINKYNNYDTTIRIYDATDYLYPEIKVSGKINANVEIDLTEWTPANSFTGHLLNIGNNDIGYFTVKNNTKDLTNYCYKNSNGKVLLCYHTNGTEKIEANEATCTKNGNTSGIKCSVCGNTISGNEMIAAKGHAFVAGKCTICEFVDLNYIPFTDVPKNSWFETAVKYCYHNNMVSGVNSHTFAPDDIFTRGMLVTILHRMEGSPYVSGTSKFSDVKDTSAYYYVAIKWATQNNIVSGYNNGKFGPEDPITREQLAVILNNYCKYKGKYKAVSADLSSFKDSDKISSFAKWGMNWAVGAGVIIGNANSKTLNPQGKTTRAEATSMLYKYCLNIK